MTKKFFIWAIKHTTMTIDEAGKFADWAAGLDFSPYDAFKLYTTAR